jgi:hypothetical protein
MYFFSPEMDINTNEEELRKKTIKELRELAKERNIYIPKRSMRKDRVINYLINGNTKNQTTKETPSEGVKGRATTSTSTAGQIPAVINPKISPIQKDPQMKAFIKHKLASSLCTAGLHDESSDESSSDPDTDVKQPAMNLAIQTIVV